jgi:protein-tyrosine phosphatase
MFGAWSKNSKNFVRVPLPVKGRLFASPMPYGPYDPARALFKTYRRSRITVAVALVTQKEVADKCKRDLFALYAKHGIELVHLSVPDLTTPTQQDIASVVDDLVAKLQVPGTNMVVHCNAGIGRTGVIVSCIVQRILGHSGEDAISYVSQYMMVDMTDEQRRAVKRWAERDTDGQG